MEDFTKIRTWAEVDLNALAHNYRALRALTPEGCKIGRASCRERV